MITNSEWYRCHYSTDITKVENYEEAIKSDKKFQLHHRLETHFSDGTPRPANARLSPAELKALGMYYDRPPEELIFLTINEHRKLHNYPGKLNPATRQDVKDKISKANKGKKHTQECKDRQSAISSASHWYNNGVIETFSRICPDGFKPGRIYKPSEEIRKSISDRNKGRKPWNAGLSGYKRGPYNRRNTTDDN